MSNRRLGQGDNIRLIMTADQNQRANFERWRGLVSDTIKHVWNRNE